MNEASVEKYLCKEVKKLHGLCIKLTSPGFNGAPDRIALLPMRRIYFIETKCKGGKVSPIQKVVHKLFALVGFPVYLLWDNNQVDKFIAEISV